MNFYIETTSSIDNSILIIAKGETEAKAWEKAIGPKPWGPAQKRMKKRYWSRKVN